MFEDDEEELGKRLEKMNLDSEILPEMSEKLQENNKAHVIASLQGLSYCKSVKVPSEEESMRRKVELPKPRRNQKKLVIFDMDETLIHCLPSQSDTGSSEETVEPDVVLKIPDYSGSEESSVLRVNIRPYA